MLPRKRPVYGGAEPLRGKGSSGRQDLNLRPLVPQTSALTKLSYIPLSVLRLVYEPRLHGNGTVIVNDRGHGRDALASRRAEAAPPLSRIFANSRLVRCHG